MEVTLLYFDGCLHWREANWYLETLAAEIPDLFITRKIVDTPEEAERFGFRGSPSVLIDGADPFAEPDTPVGLSCRIYQTPDGTAESPTPGQLHAAIKDR